MEWVTLKITKDLFDDLHAKGLISYHEVKSVEVKDDFFKDDETHKLFKKESDKSYKKLKEYKLKKRHNIK